MTKIYKESSIFMGATKHIKRILFEKDIKANDFADTLGKPPQSFYNQMGRDTWKYAEVEKIADALGCDIVFIDRETGKTY